MIWSVGVEAWDKSFAVVQSLRIQSSITKVGYLTSIIQTYSNINPCQRPIHIRDSRPNTETDMGSKQVVPYKTHIDLLDIQRS